jgi:hypothetical protein
MKEILSGTGWKVRRLIKDASPRYIAVIEKG